MRSLLPSIVALSAVAAVALVLTLGRGPVVAHPARLGATVRLAIAAVAVQAAHFTEELAAGFRVQLPALFGLAPMPLPTFFLFNLVWLAVWALSAWGLARRHRAALFPLWFLALASAVNGVAHPLLALAAADYFPGLFTAPLSGIVGVLLVRGLTLVTRPERQP